MSAAPPEQFPVPVPRSSPQRRGWSSSLASMGTRAHMRIPPPTRLQMKEPWEHNCHCNKMLPCIDLDGYNKSFDRKKYW